MNKIKTKLAKRFSEKSVKELVLGSGASFLVKLSGILFAFLFNWIVTKIYGASELGILTSAIAVLSLGAIFTKFGVDTAFLRFVASYKISNIEYIKEIERKSYFINIVLSVFITGIVYLNAEWIATSVFKKDILTDSIRIISFGFLPFTLFSLHSEGLRALKDVKSYAFIQMTGRFMFGFMVIIVLNFAINIQINPVIVFVVSLYLTLVFSFFQWQRKKRVLYKSLKTESDSFPLKDKIFSYRHIFNLSSPLMLAASSTFLMNWTDILLLTYFESADQIAIYSIAVKFGMLSKIILTSVNAIAAPQFATAFYNKNINDLRTFVQSSTKLIFYTSLPILLISILFPNFLLGLYGQEFTNASNALILFALAQFISSISGSVGYLLQMTGKQKVYQNITLISTFLNIGLNFILIPKLGINGAALSGFITIILKNLYSVYYIKKEFNFTTIYLPYSKKLWI